MTELDNHIAAFTKALGADVADFNAKDRTAEQKAAFLRQIFEAARKLGAKAAKHFQAAEFPLAVQAHAKAGLSQFDAIDRAARENYAAYNRWLKAGKPFPLPPQ